MFQTNVLVSVVVATYNPDLSKLLATLASIVDQKRITYEVIVSDDGSSFFPQGEIECYFKEVGFSSYKIERSECNTGTVRNFLRGVEAASAPYIYAISPGDMLYDELVLADFYHFATTNGTKICFGKASYYNKTGDIINLIEGSAANPPFPQLFTPEYSPKLGKTALLCGLGILGVLFFWEKESALRYLNEIKSVVKYAEDNPSAMMAVMEGDKIRYYNREMCWYEYGTGISTSGSTKWQAIIEKDFDEALKYLRQKYPKDKELHFAIMRRKWSNKLVRILLGGIAHPIINLRLIRIKLGQHNTVSYTLSGVENLKCYLGKTTLKERKNASN